MTEASTLRLLLFDCDGTLVDSCATIGEAMTRAFASEGLAAPADAAVRRVIGLSLDVAIQRLRPEASVAQLDALVSSYKQAFFELRTAQPQADPLYPGALEALRDLDAAGFILGVCTGKSRRGLDAVLDSHGIAGLFVTLQTADRHPGKPHPSMVERAMAEVGASPVDTLVIGDTAYDMEMAGNAGVRAIGVAWGYHEPVELTEAGADEIVADYGALCGVTARFLPARPL